MTISEIYSQIIGTGSYLPERRLNNFELEKMVETSDEWIKTRTGILERHIARDDEYTDQMAAKAGRAALEMAGVAAGEIDLIIVATFTPPMLTPGAAAMVQAALGADNAATMDINTACTGFIYALTVADQFIKTGYIKKALVIGAETLSKVVDWSDRNTCVLFGDGAGAAVLSAASEGGILSTTIGSDGAAGRCLTIQNLSSPEWDNAQRGGQPGKTVWMDGQEVFKFAVKAMVSSTLYVLDKAALDIGDVDIIIPHQANMRIVDSAARRLNIDRERIYTNLEHCGNISAASVPIALDHAARAGLIKNGANAVLVAFGGGLTWAGAAVKWRI